MATLPNARQFFVALEDLRASPRETKRLYDFLNLPYRDEKFAVFAKAHNVNRPDDRLLDARERERFDAIAGAMMQRLGYAQRPEYVVNY